MVASARLWRTGRLTVLILAMTAVAGPGGAVGTSPHELLVAEAMREGRVTIYSATDAAELAELLNAFRSAHPRITVDYRSLPASEVYARFKSEVASGAASADLVISSAMDLQIKLVNDEYAQPYASPERNGLPGWAVWKNEAFAVTAEPIVIGYNKHLLPDEMRPRSHDHLARLLRSQPDVFRGRVGSYDDFMVFGYYAKAISGKPFSRPQALALPFCSR